RRAAFGQAGLGEGDVITVVARQRVLIELGLIGERGIGGRIGPERRADQLGRGVVRDVLVQVVSGIRARIDLRAIQAAADVFPGVVGRNVLDVDARSAGADRR